MKNDKKFWRPALLGVLLSLLGASVVGAQEAQTFDLMLADGQVQDGVTSVRVTQDDPVVIRWQTDHETEIHLHGYDIKATLAPDAVTEMTFEAHATGRFPITAHGHHGDAHDEPVLLHVEVYPD